MRKKVYEKLCKKEDFFTKCRKKYRGMQLFVKQPNNLQIDVFQLQRS